MTKSFESDLFKWIGWFSS